MKKKSLSTDPSLSSSLLLLGTKTKNAEMLQVRSKRLPEGVLKRVPQNKKERVS